MLIARDRAWHEFQDEDSSPTFRPRGARFRRHPSDYLRGRGTPSLPGNGQAAVPGTETKRHGVSHEGQPSNDYRIFTLLLSNFQRRRMTVKNWGHISGFKSKNLKREAAYW